MNIDPGYRGGQGTAGPRPFGFFVADVRNTGVHLRALVHRRWRTSLTLGLVAGAFVVAKVLSEAATPGPEGARYFFEVAWRGVLYGTVDAILLTVFPALVALALMGEESKVWCGNLRTPPVRWS